MRRSKYAHLSESLKRGGIAPRHVRRVIRELDDHRDDLIAELQSQGLSPEESETQAARRLGQDATLIASTLARPELKSWARRWPWLAFIALPLVTLPILIVATLLLLSQALSIAEHSFGSHVISTLRQLTATYVAGMLWLLPALYATGWCVYALRRHVPAVWPIVGVVLISLLGANVNASIDWPSASSQGSVTAGVGIGTEALAQPALRAIVTLCLVLIPYLWRYRQEHRRA